MYDQKIQGVWFLLLKRQTNVFKSFFSITIKKSLYLAQIIGFGTKVREHNE